MIFTDTEASLALLTDSSEKWRVWLHNDDDNTFDYVIEVLMEVLGHEACQAEQCALITHLKGRSVVKETNEREAERVTGILKQKGLLATCCPQELSGK